VNRFFLATLAALPLLATACQPRYDGVDLTLVNNPPVPPYIDDTQIEIPLGIAAVVEVEPLSSTRFNYYTDDPLELRSRDPDVLRVEATENPRQFVLIGVGVGETCVDIEVLHEDRGCIPATVTQ